MAIPGLIITTEVITALIGKSVLSTAIMDSTKQVYDSAKDIYYNCGHNDKRLRAVLDELDLLAKMKLIESLVKKEEKERNIKHKEPDWSQILEKEGLAKDIKIDNQSVQFLKQSQTLIEDKGKSALSQSMNMQASHLTVHEPEPIVSKEHKNTIEIALENVHEILNKIQYLLILVQKDSQKHKTLYFNNWRQPAYLPKLKILTRYAKILDERVDTLFKVLHLMT